MEKTRKKMLNKKDTEVTQRIISLEQKPEMKYHNHKLLHCQLALQE